MPFCLPSNLANQFRLPERRSDACCTQNKRKRTQTSCRSVQISKSTQVSSTPDTHCTMSVGFVIPQTPIAVDHWRTEPKTCAKYYFCTHCHAGSSLRERELENQFILADHTAGLSPSWNYPIYCSRITGELLKLKFDVKPDLIVY